MKKLLLMIVMAALAVTMQAQKFALVDMVELGDIAEYAPFFLCFTEIFRRSVGFEQLLELVRCLHIGLEVTVADKRFVFVF